MPLLCDELDAIRHGEAGTYEDGFYSLNIRLGLKESSITDFGIVKPLVELEEEND